MIVIAWAEAKTVFFLAFFAKKASDTGSHSTVQRCGLGLCLLLLLRVRVLFAVSFEGLPSLPM